MALNILRELAFSGNTSTYIAVTLGEYLEHVAKLNEKKER
jgi:hypothetical protein